MENNFRTFNLNDYVYVQITQYGFEELLKHEKEINNIGFTEHCVISRKEVIDGEDWYKLQAHSIPDWFGRMIWATNPAPLKANIMFDDAEYDQLKESNKQLAEALDTTAIDFAKWMKENGVYISLDEIGEHCFDIGCTNYSAESLFEKYKTELANLKATTDGNNRIAHIKDWFGKSNVNNLDGDLLFTAKSPQEAQDWCNDNGYDIA